MSPRRCHGRYIGMRGPLSAATGRHSLSESWSRPLSLLFTWCALQSASAFLVPGLVGAASAQPTETIERPVSILVAGTAGGGIDLYARLGARDLGRHIAGNPAVTVQVMRGAGGIRAANYLVKSAPRDGTAIATFAGGPLLEPLIGARHPGYEASQFTWIGAVT